MAHPCKPVRAAHLGVLSGVIAALVLGPLAFGASAATATKKAPVCAGKTKAKAIAAIEAAYDLALNGTTGKTLDERFEAIESSDEPVFRAVLDEIAAANAGMLATTSVQVNKVTCSGKKTADVLYDLVLGGTPSPGLAGPGFAVLDGKTWKMSALTVCNLFALADPLLLEEGPCVDIALEG